MRFPVWATLFTVAAIVVLCGLGTWQLQRLEWKREMIATLDREAKKDPLQTMLAYDALQKGAEIDLKRGGVRGRFLHTREIALGPRTWNGEAGYHIFTPFELEGGGTVLINRGWVPLALKNPYSRPESLIGGDMEIGGTFHLPEVPNPFVPGNRPEKEEWYRLDLAQIAKARGLEKLAPVVLYAEVAPQAGEYPVMEATRWHPRNQHLAYAFFWFSMAGVLAVVYGVRFFRTPKA